MKKNKRGKIYKDTMKKHSCVNGKVVLEGFEYFLLELFVSNINSLENTSINSQSVKTFKRTN